MKKILWLLLITAALLIPQQGKAGIYNNSGTTGEDSIAILFDNLDTLGNPIDLVAGDSVYLMVFYPGGILAFRDSMAANNSKITTAAWEDYAGGNSYSLRYAVADVDGTPIEGTYKIKIIAHDISLGLHTRSLSEFQLYVTQDFSLAMDESQGLNAWAPITDNDSLITDQSTNTALKPTVASRTIDVATTGEAGVDFNNILGGLGAAEIDANAIGSSELAATAAAEIEDSVHQQQADYRATAFATATELAKAIDSLNALLDTLQLWDTRVDSIEAALADANFGSKAWTKPGTRSLTSQGRTEIATTVTDTVWKSLFSARNAVAGSFADSAENWAATSAGSLTATQIADTVWKALMSVRSGVAGSFGDSAQGWGATGASATDTSNIKTMLTNNPTVAGGQADVTKISGDANAADSLEAWLDGTGATMHLKALRILADYKDTAFVVRSGDSSAVAVFWKGGDSALGQEAYAWTIIGGDSVGGVLWKGGAAASLVDIREGIAWSVETGNYATDFNRAVNFDAGADVLVMSVYQSGGDVIVMTPGTSGSAIDINTPSTDALIKLINTGTGDDIKADKFVKTIWDIAFSTGFTAGSMGDSLTNTTYVQGAASGLTAASVATAVKDTAANNAGIFYGPTASGAGTDTVIIVALDTLGTDTTLADVKITVKNSGGSSVAVANTLPSGQETFYLDPGTYTVIGRQAAGSPSMHLFDSYSMVVSGNMTDTLMGYDFSIGSSTGDSVCRVYGYIYDIDGVAANKAKVTFELQGTYNDTCNNRILANFSATALTDATGYFSQNLTFSSCVGSVQYRIKAVIRGGQVVRGKTFTVPDSTSHLITW